MRELAAYFAFLGEDVDPDGLDHDVADWQGEYDGVAGVMLVVVDPAGDGGGHRGGAPPRAGCGRAQAHVAAPGLPRARAGRRA